jgi:adenylylsulfate kinase
MMILLFCGLSGAGKSTLSEAVRQRLTRMAVPVEVLDGDEYRSRMFTDLGFSRQHRIENLRRLGFIADKFAAHGIVTIISAISPYEEARRELAERYPDVKVIFVDCGLDELRRRDTKGLYSLAALPEGSPEKLTCLSGVNDPFQPPVSPDLHVNTQHTSIDDCCGQLCDYVLRHVRKIGREIGRQREGLRHAE